MSPTRAQRVVQQQAQAGGRAGEAQGLGEGRLLGGPGAAGGGGEGLVERHLHRGRLPGQQQARPLLRRGVPPAHLEPLLHLRPPPQPVPPRCGQSLRFILSSDDAELQREAPQTPSDANFAYQK